jgi:hypothetical protein
MTDRPRFAAVRSPPDQAHGRLVNSALRLVDWCGQGRNSCDKDFRRLRNAAVGLAGALALTVPLCSRQAAADEVTAARL